MRMRSSARVSSRSSRRSGADASLMLSMSVKIDLSTPAARFEWRKA
jgi:hypothetical protein